MCGKCDARRADFEVREVDSSEREVIEKSTGEAVGRMLLRPPNWMYPDEAPRWSAHHREDPYVDDGIRYDSTEEALNAIIQRVRMYEPTAYDWEAEQERRKRAVVIYD